jgi:hypothetical protein
MRTGKEMIQFIEDRIKSSGRTKSDVLLSANCSLPIFIMARKRNSYLKLETLISLAKTLGISVSDILGEGNEELPEDIKQMISMLKSISPENRKMIAMNIENYLKVEVQKNV